MGGLKFFFKACINSVALCPIVDFISRYPSRPMSAEAQEAAREMNKKIMTGGYTLEYVSCEVCGSDEMKVLFTNDRYHIKWSTVCCKKCGLVFSNPRFDETSNAHFYGSDLYRLIYSSGEHEGGYEGRYVYKRKKPVSYDLYDRSLYYDFIEEHLAGKYESVLEIGAGGGWNLVPFLEDGKICAGYEYSTRLVKEAQKRNICIIQGSENDINGKYDLIIMKHVLEHFLKPVAQLRSIVEHIQENGYLFVEVPGFVHAVPSLQNAHTYYFSPQRLLDIVQKAGLSMCALRVFPQNGFIFMIAQKNRAEGKMTQPLVNEYQQVMKIARRFKVRALIHFK